MESFRIQRTSSGQIGLERQVRPLKPAGSKARSVAAGQELEVLSRIIEGLNERFGLNLGNEHRLTLEQLRSALDQDPGLDASARVNTRENVRLTFDPKVEDRIQEIVETNFDLYKRITDDPDFGRAIKDLLFDDYIQRHRRVEDLLKLQESKTLEFKSSLRWSLKEDRKDDKHVTHAALKTIAAFLNTEGGDLLIGVDDDRKVLGIEHDRLDNDDKFMRHLAQVVRNGLGDRVGTCIDPRTQVVEGKTVCLVSCQRSPEPVYLRWKGLEKAPEGDFYVRSGRGDGAAQQCRCRHRELCRPRGSARHDSPQCRKSCLTTQLPSAESAIGLGVEARSLLHGSRCPEDASFPPLTVDLEAMPGPQTVPAMHVVLCQRPIPTD